MAEDEKSEEAEEEKESKGMSMGLFLGVAVGLSLLIGGGGFAGAYFLLPSLLADQLKEGTSQEIVQQDGEEGDKKEKGDDKKSKKLNDPVEEVTEFSLHEIVVNVSGTRGTRFAKAAVFFDAEAEVLGELEGNRAKIMELVSQTISSKTLDELTSPTARGVLRKEILSGINPLLSTGKVDNVYFTDFIIQ